MMGDFMKDDRHLPCFKAYDIRGRVPEELNEDLVYDLGRAYATRFKPSRVAIGRDIRLTSQGLACALCRGLNDNGVDVLDIGLCGTEMIYFAVPFLHLDGGIMITASHNPPEYNGIKLVREHSIPVSGDTGLFDLEKCILEKSFAPPAAQRGSISHIDIMQDFTGHLLSFIKPDDLKPLEVVVNPGNGCAGPVLEELEKVLPLKFHRLNFKPDGTFPSGVPNPLLPENRQETIDAIRLHGADLGAAWDGDYDRCFFFDEKGEFIEGYYMVGLLAASMLSERPGSRIIHDPRLTWNTIEIVTAMHGLPVVSKTGHAFIKERMRKEDALYGGEMSAHHYFKDNFYCDSGIIPFLLTLQILSSSDRPFSQLIGHMQQKYPVSGEINRRIEDPAGALKKIEALYRDGSRDYTDGISVEYPCWRFNLRLSNTEPLVRLNVETRGDRELLMEKTDEILRNLDS
jgi:phosphomannomutase